MVVLAILVCERAGADQDRPSDWDCDLSQIYERYPQIPANAWRNEHPEQCLIAAHVRRGARVLELGGRIGRATIVAAETVGAGGRVWVSEASPQIAKKLHENVASIPTVAGLLPAISDEPVFVRLGPGGGVTSSDPAVVSTWAGARRIPTVRLETLATLEFDTVIADCEGCFHALVRDHPSELLRDGAVKMIVLEDDTPDSADAAALQAALSDAGFTTSACKLGFVDSPTGGERIRRDCFYRVLTRE